MHTPGQPPNWPYETGTSTPWAVIALRSALDPVRRPSRARGAAAAEGAVAAGVAEERPVEEQERPVQLVRLDVGDVRLRRDRAAGLVDPVGDRRGAAAADLRVDQLVAVALAVLVAIAGEQRGERPVGGRGRVVAQLVGEREHFETAMDGDRHHRPADGDRRGARRRRPLRVDDRPRRRDHLDRAQDPLVPGDPAAEDGRDAAEDRADQRALGAS